ncbi:MAG TPA: hypothetical protein VK680_07060 [Solirubrobacteraceae bacterium]|jgi:hypothetical protein|nr:hypothetical protein [Solirubrobacteraceae bacterium]
MRVQRSGALPVGWRGDEVQLVVGVLLLDGARLGRRLLGVLAGVVGRGLLRE